MRDQQDFRIALDQGKVVELELIQDGEKTFKYRFQLPQLAGEWPAWPIMEQQDGQGDNISAAFRLAMQRLKKYCDKYSFNILNIDNTCNAIHLSKDDQEEILGDLGIPATVIVNGGNEPPSKS